MFTFKSFANLPISHAISSKNDGNIDLRFSDQQTVTNNLSGISSQLGIDPYSIVQAEQMHATDIALVSKENAGQKITGVDGLITNSQDISLMLRIADCAPIIIYDPKKHALGLVHSGWRGTIGKISLVAVQSMMRHFGSNPTDLIVGIGPCIDKQKIDRTPMQNDLPEWKEFIDSEGTKFTVDLVGFIKHTLTKTGVSIHNIEVSGINTTSSNEYFSYQKSKESGEPDGRFATIAKLK